MNKKSKNKLIWVAIIVVIIGIFSYAMYQDSIPGKYDDFTKCLKDKGAIFYGAFWCPHCQKQKSLFGKSKKYLPYVECSTADGRGQVPQCNDKNITSYPTWIFGDSSQETGELSLETLAEKTGCALSQ